jgi:hypothetical protein
MWRCYAHTYVLIGEEDELATYLWRCYEALLQKNRVADEKGAKLT